MTLDPTIPMRQRSALFKVRDNETPEYGVIIEPVSTAAALVRRGLAEEAPRRAYARHTGLCLRLTPAGRDLCAEVERLPNQ